MTKKVIAGFGRGFGIGYWTNTYYHYTQDKTAVVHTICILFWTIHIIVKVENNGDMG